MHNSTCCYRNRLVEGNDNTPASAQLVRLGVLADRQAQSLTSVESQVTKLQLRTRLMGRDVKPLLKTVRSHNTVVCLTAIACQGGQNANSSNSQLVVTVVLGFDCCHHVGVGYRALGFGGRFWFADDSI